MNGPLVVEVTRGWVVESRHQVIAAVVDVAGAVIRSHGEGATPVAPRSAVKSLQALRLVGSGAAAAFELDDEHLALACASHSGEPGHVALVESWLARLDLTPDDLECGPSLPRDPAASAAHVASGGQAERVLHNCSGKHAGFLTLARHLGVEPRGYLGPTHPVQEEVLAALAAAAEVGGETDRLLVDGCGAPVLVLPLERLARAMAAMVNPDAGWAEDASRLRTAIRSAPWYVAGTDRLDTRVAEALDGAGFVKWGAEGVYVAALAELGLGVAVKALDGARRAAEAAIVHLLVELGAIEREGPLADLVRPPVTNSTGDVVGEIRVQPVQ